MTRKKRARRIAIGGLAFLLAGSYVAYAYSQPITTLRPTTTFAFSRPAQAVSLQWPSYGESAVGAVGYGVLAVHGQETALPTASVAKVLTALAVLQRKPKWY